MGYHAQFGRSMSNDVGVHGWGHKEIWERLSPLLGMGRVRLTPNNTPLAPHAAQHAEFDQCLVTR